MAISYGFFNSVGDDRLYNAESFNTYFEGLISQNGIFADVGDMFVVAAGTGLNVTVGTGKALVNSHWIKSTASETLSIAAAHNLFGRYDAVVLRWNASTRDVTLEVKTGTPATNPQRPNPVRDASEYEIILAYVYINANATALTTGNIYDQRANTAVCGFITGLINQVDIAELFAQYESRFEALEDSMLSWQQQQQNTFDAWYYNLTQNLTVGAYIEKFSKIVVGGVGVSNTIPLDMEGYSYDNNDVLLVNLNGLMLQPVYDYLLDTTTTPVTIHINGELTSTNRFEIVVLKSNMARTSGGLLTSATGTKFINVSDALAGAAYGFTVGTLGTTNEIAVANRNLFRIDLLSDTTSDGITFTKNNDGSFTVNGTSEAANVAITSNIDKNAFVVGSDYTINSGKNSGNVSVKVTLNYTDNTSEDFTSTNSPTTFSITKAVASATGSIIIAENGAVADYELIKAQLEYGSSANTFKNNSYSTFVYDGHTLPLLTDNINNIWSNDDAVSDLQLIYIVLASDLSDGDYDQY